MQTYQIRLEQVKPIPIAIVRDRASVSNLVERLMAGFSKVWRFVKDESNGVKSTGNNVAIYLNDPGKNLLETPEGVPMEIGAQLVKPFDGAGEVKGSTTPAGMAAVTTHVGPYHEIPKAYEAIFKWMKENRRDGAGPCWEIYGHWAPDEAKLTTEIYCLLK